MENQVIVGIGEALWDVLPEGKKLGGAPANFAYHVSQFGLESCIVSAVGDDALGQEIKDNFEEKKLNHILETVPYPTGTVQVEIDLNGVPQYEIKENVAWDNIQFTPEVEALAKRTRALCYGSLAQRNEVSRATINRFIDAMPKTEDTLIVFDVNLRQRFYTKEVLDESMRRCNVLKINDEELVTISRMLGYPGTDLQSKCWILLGRYDLKMLILTSGNMSYLSTPMVEVADTVGAGDSFTATFTSSIIKGQTVAESHRRAVEVSAFVCTQHGATPILPKKFTEGF